MGRKPTVNLNLPKGMRSHKQRSGRIYYYYDLGGKPRKELPLGEDYPLAVKKWAELEVAKIPTDAKPTLKDAIEKYMKDVLPTKGDKTQRENLRELGRLQEFFCNPIPAPLDEIEPMHIRMYLDMRKNAPVAANREKALLSHIWNKAREWGYTSMANPCTGVKGFTEAGRDIYIEDSVYQAVYNAGDVALRDAMDLAYLTGQRPADVLALTESDIKNGEVCIQQNKTSKKLRITIQGELATLIDRITKRKSILSLKSINLVITENGSGLTRGALRSRFDKARELAAKTHPELASSITAFQFRDLRAKAGTDKAESAGDIRQAQKQLGHSSVKMTEQYVRDRKGDKVGPTR